MMDQVDAAAVFASLVAFALVIELPLALIVLARWWRPAKSPDSAPGGGNAPSTSPEKGLDAGPQQKPRAVSFLCSIEQPLLEQNSSTEQMDQGVDSCASQESFTDGPHVKQDELRARGGSMIVKAAPAPVPAPAPAPALQPTPVPAPVEEVAEFEAVAEELDFRGEAGPRYPRESLREDSHRGHATSMAE